MRLGKSTATVAGARPAYRGWAASWTIRAASMRFFEGRQPRLAHVPPGVRRSTIATRAPRSEARIAAAKAVEPEPRMRKSNGSGIRGRPAAPLEGVVLPRGADSLGQGRSCDVRARGDDRAAGGEIDRGLLDAGHG